MNLPNFNAEASLYLSSAPYRSMAAGVAWSQGASGLTPQMGECPIFHSGCTVPDRACASGFSEFIQRADCSTDFFCCTPSCETRCTPCEGGSCGTYPNCGAVAGSGTQTCTDCHGKKTTRSC